MRTQVQKLYASSEYSKVVEWGKLISITGSAQAIVQGLALISGILIIRILPPQEYALYTLANTMLGTLTVLADSGISSSMMSQGGKVWQDPKKLGAVLVTGMDMRKKFAIISLIISSPILFYLLLLHGATWITALIIFISLIPAFFAAITDTILEVAPKLRQDIVPLQKNQIWTNASRLFLVGVSAWIFPCAFIAILCGGLPRIWANVRLRKVSSGYVDWSQQPDYEVRKTLTLFVKRILPGTVYYCISGQIMIWAISIFGSTTSVAHVGALSRLGMILNLFSVLFVTILSPRFSRLTSHKPLLLKRFFHLQIIMLVASILIVMIALIFPTELLWILGSDYSNLQWELLLNIVGSCLYLIAGLNFGLFTSRGWVINPIVSIPIGIVSIVVGVTLFELSSLKGILELNIFLATVQVLLNGGYCLMKITKVE